MNEEREEDEENQEEAEEAIEEEEEEPGKQRETGDRLTWCTRRFRGMRLLRIMITAADSRSCDLNLVSTYSQVGKELPERTGTKGVGQRGGRETGRRKKSVAGRLRGRESVCRFIRLRDRIKKP